MAGEQDLATQALERWRAFRKLDASVVECIVAGNFYRLRLAQWQVEFECQLAGATDVDTGGRVIQTHVQRTVGDIADEVAARTGCDPFEVQHRIGCAQIRDVDPRSAEFPSVDATLAYADHQGRPIHAHVAV